VSQAGARTDATLAPSAGAARAGRLARGAIERSGALRRVVKSGLVQEQVKTARALSVVRERPRLLRGRLSRRGTGRYELRRSGRPFHLRHGSNDVAILNKIFARDPSLSGYEPPAAVASALAATPAPRILDVGANIGLFGVFALERWPDAEITSFEPDPDNFRVLDLTVAANRRDGYWDAVPAAVSDREGELSFAPGGEAKAHLAPGGAGEETIVVPAVDFFGRVGDGVDLVKMDIEGGEWSILADPRMASVPARVIRLEWHTEFCPAEDARAEAIRLLGAAGYANVVDGDRRHARNGVVWAWRESI
jgi:FkbM family methyltransferase